MSLPPGSQHTREHLALAALLIDKLAALPAEVTASDYRYDLFGSWWLVVRRRGLRYRVAFDGRDRTLFVHSIDTDNPPEEPSTLVATLPLPTGLTSATLELVATTVAEATLGVRQ